MASWFYSSAPAHIHVQLSTKGEEPVIEEWTTSEDAGDVFTRLEAATAAEQPVTGRARARLKIWAEGALPSNTATALKPLVLLLNRQSGVAAAIASLKCEDHSLALCVGAALPLMPCLHTLNLTGVGLAALPAELCRGAAPTLRKLVVRQNRLTALPPEVGHLSLLALLDASHNQLTALPSELSQCEALAHLWLEDNGIGRLLPSAFARLSSLRSLLVAFNPLDSLPQLVPLSR
eukprot:CAMPEP_0206041654 /NCGR_PEP_ID=MMETSP1466-20131121/6091_1 /ASSEMBLY_ACC=CAM_ASM_001126 /TAXON_ID=44452 /ORGANISM="Pavlova gyrans, Strain CCMP608" /LENGTH=233 /DNA_ID=CAMNT_0053416357 /DNA_START=51 /DNA_END=748 /DNA_ORIENTATION=+